MIKKLTEEDILYKSLNTIMMELGYIQVAKFREDFKKRFKKSFKEKKQELRIEFIKSRIYQYTDEEIAEQLGVTSAAVQYIRVNKLKIRRTITRKPKSPKIEKYKSPYLYLKILKPIENPDRLIINRKDKNQARFKLISKKQIIAIGEIYDPLGLFNIDLKIRDYLHIPPGKTIELSEEYQKELWDLSWKSSDFQPDYKKLNQGFPQLPRLTNKHKRSIKL